MDPAAERLAPLLQRLVDYEQRRPNRRLWDLATMAELLQRPGAPPPPRPAVQVGGSKGKGTTCAFLEALALAAGRSVGFYSSPHVATLLERIRRNREPIDVATLGGLLERIVAAAGPERPPTFFEAMTLAAAEWFASERTDLAIWEVGLGGRYDATTALPVDVGIVTTIELEHTDVLGPTIAAIAGEKAPVVRPGGIGFTGTTGEALAVVRAHARSVGAELHALGETFGAEALQWSGTELRGRLWLPDGRRLPFRLPDARGYEVPALALAAAAFAVVCPGAPLCLDPVPRPRLPCRFEVFAEPDGQPLVLDGAHTEQSLQAVADECRRRWPGRPPAVLFGSAQGKRWREGLSRLLPLADRFVVTAVSGTHGEDPAALRAWLEAQGARVELAADAATGLAALRRGPGPRLVAGSFYLAGAVRELLRHGSDPASG